MRLCYPLALALALAAPVAAQGYTCDNGTPNRCTVDPGIGTLNAAVAAEGDDNTVFALQRGALYVLDGQVTNAGYHLRLEATGSATRPPVVQPAANTDGSTPDRSFRLEGDFTATGIYFLGMDDNGGLQSQYFRVYQPDVTVTLDDCIGDYSRFAFIRFEAADGDVRIQNSLFRNNLQPGNSGNGRLVVSFRVPIDSVVIRNSTIVGLGGGIFTTERELANYFELVHTTVYLSANGFLYDNGATTVRDMKVTDNLFVDVALVGNETNSANPNGLFTVVGLDGVDLADRNIEFSNNNYAFTERGQQYFTNASNREPRLFYSEATTGEIWDALRASGAIEDATTEAISFDTLPPEDEVADFFAYAKEFFVDNQTGDFTDPAIDEDADPAGPPKPGSVVEVFPFTLDLSYPQTTAAYSGATGGCPLGDLNWFEDDAAVNVDECLRLATPSEGGPEVAATALRVFPNPARTTATLSFELDAPAEVGVRVYDLLGRQVLSVPTRALAAGPQPTALDVAALGAGVYVYRVTVDSASGTSVQSGKLVVVR